MPAPKPTPERQKAIAEGMALVQAGQPMDAAARTVGVPPTTLRRWYERCYAADAEAMNNVEAMVIGQSLELANEAAARLLQRLDGADTKTLATVYGIATDKVAKARGWGQQQEPDPTNNALGQAFAAIAQSGGTVSLTVTPTPDAIDVTPTSTDDDDS